jgi:CelD/BcsL family acetyltransferase involved in cellulose biosynthesis
MAIDTCEQSTGLSVALVDDLAALRRLEPEWARLLAATAKPEPMLSPAWVLTWWKHYQAGRSLAVGVFRDRDALVGVAPLCRRKFKYRAGIPFRRLELMGAGGEEVDGVCGEYLGPIDAKGRETDVARAFAAALQRDALGPWDELVLEHMDGHGAMTAALIEALPAIRGDLTCHTEVQAYYLPLPADWEAFLATLHGKRRQKFRRTWKDFVAWVGDKGYVLERARSAEDVPRGMTILAALHAQRWQEEGQQGVFASPRFSRFHQQFATRLLEDNQLDLLWLTVGNEPVAAHYSFAVGGKVYFYQSGRRMDVPSNVRIGIVMFMLAIQDAMARGLAEYDFLGGESAYKLSFTTLTRPLLSARVARRTLREITRRGLSSAAHAARRLGLAAKTPPPARQTSHASADLLGEPLRVADDPAGRME